MSRNRAARRAQAKALTRSNVDIERVIPAAPAPEWAHWWSPEHRQWFRHDERLIEYLRLLQAAETGPYADAVAQITDRIVELLTNIRQESLDDLATVD